LNKFNLHQSLYNTLLLHGHIPHVSGIISLLAKEKQNENSEEGYKAQRITFSITPPNTNISIQRSFAMLESIEHQDLFSWKDEFEQTIALASWDENTALGVLKASVTNKYLHLVQTQTTLTGAWSSIFQHKYPYSDHIKYLNQLSNIRQNTYLTIKEYRNQIVKLCTRLAICLGWGNEAKEQKIIEAFYNGLSKRCQLEMARLNVKDCKEMYALINSTEETLIEQIRSIQPKKNKHKGTPQNSRYSKRLYNSDNNKYCTHHKVKTHNTNECKALKRKQELSNKSNDHNNTSQTYAIKEIRPKTTALESTGYIKNKLVNFIIDTGSAYSYIDSKIVNEIDLECYKVEDMEAITVTGDTVKSNKEAKVPLRIQGDKCNEYTVTARVLKNMSSNLILGMDFLTNLNSVINLKNSTFSVDNKEYEIMINNEYNTPDKIFETRNDILSLTGNVKSSRLDKLLEEYKAQNPPIGKIENYSHIIHLETNKLLKTTPFKIPLSIRDKTKEEIDRLLDLRIIQKSESPYNSPALPIYKRNGTIRLVIDYRKINSYTTPDSYPFPDASDILTCLNGSTVFSQIDLSMGYYQIPMAEESRKYTAFSIFGEHYEFLRMPFGLTNAPRTFQKAMNKMLGDFEFVKIFLDDILIHSPDAETHENHLIQVLSKLKESNVSINFDKSRFFKTEVVYLGHKIDKNGTRADTSRLLPFEKIIPKTKKQLQRLIGLLNWYRPYIKNLSNKILKLTDKLRGNKAFEWKNEDTDNLKKIYEEIKEQTLLHYPDIKKPFTIETDASERAMGAILKQNNNIVGIYSYKFNKSEEKYTVVEKETFAIAKALIHFKNIIFNSKVIVKTDNKDLITTGPLTKRTERWKSILQEFNITLEHIKGKNNKYADAISRIFTIGRRKEIKIFTIDEICKLQQENNKFQVKSEHQNIKKINDLFVDDKGRIYIPSEASEFFISRAHISLVHPGESKLYKTLKPIFNIPNIKTVIKRIAKKCIKCCLCKEKNIKYGKIKGNINSEKWLELISSDIFGPIKTNHFKTESKKEYFYIITFTDVYSRYTLIDITWDITAKTLAKSFEMTVIKNMGIPKSILTDQGRQYISQEFNILLSNYGINHVYSSAYNPTGNSVSERINKTIGDICRIFKGSSLHELKEMIETRINMTYHRILDTSPFELLNKYSAVDPLKRVMINNKKTKQEIKEKRINEILTNSKRKIHEYKVGDKVFKKTFDPDKINDLYSGPFTIMKVSKDKNYVIIKENNKTSRQNIKNITPFFDEEGKMSYPTYVNSCLEIEPIKKGVSKNQSF
ncbi:Transposon Tf2-6 polyprotein, partial [Dictyocoela muelleri]